ncbi:histidinol dehydrogenase [Sphingomonas parva]|uniref:Multifunctional fusion protein n=1 Tax=Sphingomonas parva TaxID=2555898 RepID=A0A4Y8ZVW7_9SPHN|nr:histidinol dehydrogenase [Sphingomonas parva]TFI58576.1 histidinol dehydrogenase [Sphingomonas parva]
MKFLDWTSLDADARKTALARPEQRSDPALQAAVRAIVDDVRTGGWDALVAQATRLDGEAPRRVPVAPIAAEARRSLAPEQTQAIALAVRNVEAFHRGSLPAEHEVETVPGLSVRKVWRSIDRVGLYIPGGKTPLFSTLLMLALPAKAAGVREIVAVTPPRPEGGLDPVIALAAELCGIDALWTVGGAQAIAALAFGAGDIPAVAKICGPGNAWVAEAKNYVASLPGGVAIDMPAGPSELMVIADETADVGLVAADLLSQAEHDPSAQVLLATPSQDLIGRIERELQGRAAALPRATIAQASLAHARILRTADLGEAAEVANLYAPEHLSLAVAEPAALVGAIRNAGAVFAGPLAAETFGDYLAGSSHVLPTDGAARAWSGVSVYTFLKAMSVQTVTPEAAARIAAPAAALARLEGLEAHARAADARLGAGTTPPTRLPEGRGVGSGLAARLARPEILALPAFDIAAAANDAFGPDAIKLDANENPYGPLSEGALAKGLNRYPEPQPMRLKQAMAALYGVGPENLIVTRGADDAIDILVRTFCRGPEDAISICTPTFSAYAHFAQLQGARVIDAKLDANFDFDADAFIETVRGERSLKLAFLCSPNNPTGNPVDPADVLRVADALPETMIVLDEAYLEFSETPSLAEEATRRPNLVVLKTLSKAYGLAGARVGALLGPGETIAIAARALPPYPLPTLSIEAALAALAPSRRPIHLERIARIKADRERLAGLFAGSPIVETVRSGGGNFLFLEVDDPAGLARKLNGLGIRVRFRPNAAPGGVRLTIGTDAENEAALAAFGVTSSDAPARRAEVVRDTKETKIAVAVDLDRSAPRQIETGIPFYDHMLDQVAAHAGFSLVLSCDGDLDIDGHHSIEDCAIAFGTALSRALADRRGIGRFGFSLPMDETEAHVLIDLSGRPYTVFEGEFEASHIGAYPTEMTRHVFRSLADSLGAAIHVRVEGENDHHKTEACFKAFGRALRQAVAREGDRDAMPSTKGVL